MARRCTRNIVTLDILEGKHSANVSRFKENYMEQKRGIAFP